MNVPSDTRASRQFGDSRPPHLVSFEFFPPKTDAMEERFWDSVGKLAPLHPHFVSVTYGAGGTTRERTLRMVSQIQSQTGVNAAAHLTCVGASKAEVDAVVRGYKEAGITRIVALRGDP
ncbi:MAG TPA: methylenetetrahydrofolate reductase, partial [Devosia sp.]|nr:methylenetetrahydrofolate reductase [Devosia sp.]